MQSTVTHPPRPRSLLRTGVGVAVLAVAAGYLAAVVDLAVLRTAAGEVAGAPLTVSAAVLAYAAAFGLRTWAWCHVLPGLSAGQSWAALHVSLLGNHLLPLRLGEVLRVTSVRRRTALPLAPVLSSAVLLRASDLLALLLLAALAAPALLGAGSGGLVSVPAAGCSPACCWSCSRPPCCGWRGWRGPAPRSGCPARRSPAPPSWPGCWSRPCCSRSPTPPGCPCRTARRSRSRR